MDADGYARRDWWSDAGWAWRQNTRVIEPLHWHDRRWNGPNQPVVGVSCWEAEACATWAGGRLPREEEWEAAARGAKGRVYPWGDRWQNGMCNTREAGLSGTSSVGLFPSSRGLGGLDDLAGNVWEWCKSRCQESDNAAPMLRGGAWLNSQRNVRCAKRDRGDPYLRYKSIGFRVVCSSPIEVADH
jgi:formylglycine-generating enzyme required for sulfatase activity